MFKKTQVQLILYYHSLFPSLQLVLCFDDSLFSSTDLPSPAMRERPPGCKTVFVGGLPENATEALIVEVFGQCGDIIAIRKSKKNFCHIRFTEEFTVDRALFLSGTLPMFPIKHHEINATCFQSETLTMLVNEKTTRGVVE